MAFHGKGVKCMGIMAIANASATTVGNTLSGIVTSEMLGGVMDEVKGLLPVVIPVSIGYLALRKGLSFLLGTLRRA